MTGDGKNNELIPCFMSLLTDEEKLLYGQIINYLLELGYTPKKNKVQGYSLSFKHKKLNKTIARMGIHGGKEVVRCGAYPIVLPNFDANDIDEVKSLLLEQHYYFLSIA